VSARTVGLLLWLLIAGLAAATVFWQVTHPPRPPAKVNATKRPPELPAVTPARRFQLPPLDQYGEIVAHPLFIATRRPEPPPPPEEAPPEKPVATPGQKLMLLGVIIAPDMKAALLRPEEPNAKTARIKLGETVGEWRLEAIFPNRVVVRKGQVTQELALVRPKKPAGPRAGRTGAKQGQDKVPPANVPVVPQPAELPQSVIVPTLPPPPQTDG